VHRFRWHLLTSFSWVKGKSEDKEGQTLTQERGEWHGEGGKYPWAYPVEKLGGVGGVGDEKREKKAREGGLGFLLGAKRGPP